MAIWVVLLIFAISIVTVDAGETQKINENEKSISVEIGSIASDGTISAETLEFTEEEIVELQNTMSLIMGEIENIKDLSSLKELIERFLGDDNPMSGKLLQIFTGLKLVKNRAFVISLGQGRDLSPLKKISFKIRKKIGIWHYNSNGMFNGRTIIVQPFKLKMKTLRGSQVGIMTGFVGVYLSFSKGFLGKSYTFFMGTARHINGLQLLSPKI